MERTGYSWATTILAGMASYLDAAAIVGTGIALVLFREGFALGSGDIGLLSSLLTIGIAVGAGFGGNLGDRFGRKRVFMLTLMLFLVGLIIAIFTPNKIGLFVALPLIGLAAGADLPVSLAMIAEAVPERKIGKMITFTHVLWMLGIMAAHVIGIIVGDMGDTGARIMYAHLAVITLIVLVLRSFLPESAKWQALHKSSQQADGTRVNLGSLKAMVQNAYLAPLIAVSLFYALVNIPANTMGQFNTYLFVEAAGSTVSLASTVGFSTAFLSLAATFTLMRLVDTAYRRIVFIVGMSASLCAFIIPVLLGVSTATLIAMSVLYAMGGIIGGEPMFKVWAQELFPTEYRASAQGIAISFTRVVAAITGGITPLIIAYSDKLIFVFVFGAVLIAAGIGLLWISRFEKVRAR
ncbi:MFS transporter [Kushneria pakistanensis]|uniref:MFS transporter n=2 Tax=Kushneria pakistanensis TaxID=1508770 RepID=A0ABQ3FIZ3_9GAMM|nr:MFS transporter [Kushneria pakistanensis]